MVEKYGLLAYIEIIDYIIIAIFAADLVFKYLRTKHLHEFLKKYWIDILAVFPFFLLFRFYEVTIGLFTSALSENAQTAQKIIHEGLVVEKESSMMIRGMEQITAEAEQVGKIERSTRFARFIRPLFRIPRFLKAAPHSTKFYEKPNGEHHEHEYMQKYKVK